MKVIPLDASSIADYLRRLDSITLDSQRKWGSMEHVVMFGHLRRSLEMTLGDVEVKDNSNIFTRTLVPWFVFHIVPWPKGKIKAPPIFFPEKYGDFDSEKEQLRTTMNRFADLATREPRRKGISPVFGPHPFSEWAYMHGKHTDHHFRQFGI